jgi:transposase
VHELSEQGLSIRAIARQTGHHRESIKRWLTQPVPDLPEDMPTELAKHASLPAPLQRQAKKRDLKILVHQLARRKLSYSAIARQVGVHRVTVKKWLQEKPPSAEAEVNFEPVPLDPPVPPPESWSSWDEVREIREALQEHRFLLLRRPENLGQEEQDQMVSLLASPLGPKLQVVRSFLEDWYAFWIDENGQRLPLADAQTRYQAWRANSDYRAVPQLLRVQERLTEAKFERLSQFLRNSGWEATNNGAERAGRAFRHRQAPHFNLRKKEHIENAINVASCLRMNATLQLPPPPFHTCQRGRRRHVTSDFSIMMGTAIASAERVKSPLPKAA